MTVFLQEEARRPERSSLVLWPTSTPKGVPPIVGCLRSDNGTEFIKPEFVAMLNQRGIHREYTPADSPKHDGVVELLVAMTLALAMASGLQPPPPAYSATQGCRRCGPSELGHVSTGAT